MIDTLHCRQGAVARLSLVYQMPHDGWASLVHIHVQSEQQTRRFAAMETTMKHRVALIRVGVGVISLLALGTTATSAVGPGISDETTSISLLDFHRASLVGGRVVDTNGDPVEGARVVLIDHNQQVVRSAMSDENGLFKFRPVKAGPYLVKAQHPQVGVGQKPVLAQPHQANRVLIELS